jgi:hypothetical protein
MGGHLCRLKKEYWFVEGIWDSNVGYWEQK